MCVCTLQKLKAAAGLLDIEAEEEEDEEGRMELLEDEREARRDVYNSDGDADDGDNTGSDRDGSVGSAEHSDDDEKGKKGDDDSEYDSDADMERQIREAQRDRMQRLQVCDVVAGVGC